jgi:nitrogen regulatory protein PII
MKTLLAINIMPALEEDMVDYLLATKGVEGFTSFAIRGHGDHSNLSLAEQVTGRRNRLQFEIITEEAVAQKIIAGLVKNVGKNIIYWQQTISNIGRV